MVARLGCAKFSAVQKMKPATKVRGPRPHNPTPKRLASIIILTFRLPPSQRLPSTLIWQVRAFLENFIEQREVKDIVQECTYIKVRRRDSSAVQKGAGSIAAARTG